MKSPSEIVIALTNHRDPNILQSDYFPKLSDFHIRQDINIDKFATQPSPSPYVYFFAVPWEYIFLCAPPHCIQSIRFPIRIRAGAGTPILDLSFVPAPSERHSTASCTIANSNFLSLELRSKLRVYSYLRVYNTYIPQLIFL